MLHPIQGSSPLVGPRPAGRLLQRRHVEKLVQVAGGVAGGGGRTRCERQMRTAPRSHGRYGLEQGDVGYLIMAGQTYNEWR